MVNKILFSTERITTTKAPPKPVIKTTTPYPYTLDVRFKEENSTSEPCGETPTIFKGRSSCKGKLILNEPFSAGPKPKYWTIEQTIAGSPVSENIIILNV